MIQKKAVNDIFNDGVCTICREMKNPTTFAARQGATRMSDLDRVVTLAFATSYIREKDSEFANQVGYRLDRKIMVRKPGNIRIDTECSAVIGRTLYHISNTDEADRKVYLYLTMVRELEE